MIRTLEIVRLSALSALMVLFLLSCMTAAVYSDRKVFWMIMAVSLLAYPFLRRRPCALRCAGTLRVLDTTCEIVWMIVAVLYLFIKPEPPAHGFSQPIYPLFVVSKAMYDRFIFQWGIITAASLWSKNDRKKTTKDQRTEG